MKSYSTSSVETVYRAWFHLYSPIVVLDGMGHSRDSTAKLLVLLDWLIKIGFVKVGGRRYSVVESVRV